MYAITSCLNKIWYGWIVRHSGGVRDVSFGGGGGTATKVVPKGHQITTPVVQQRKNARDGRERRRQLQETSLVCSSYLIYRIWAGMTLGTNQKKESWYKPRMTLFLEQVFSFLQEKDIFTRGSRPSLVSISSILFSATEETFGFSLGSLLQEKASNILLQMLENASYSRPSER